MPITNRESDLIKVAQLRCDIAAAEFRTFQVKLQAIERAIANLSETEQQMMLAADPNDQAILERWRLWKHQRLTGFQVELAAAQTALAAKRENAARAQGRSELVIKHTNAKIESRGSERRRRRLYDV